MSFLDRYVSKVETNDNRYGKRVESTLNVGKIVTHIGIVLVALIALLILNPINSVPTGSRGVVTQFGKIVRIENEGLALLLPWEKLSTFSIRAETANIDKAPGSTKDLQQVDTSLTVRYAISPDRVAYVYENYSHDGD